MYIKSIRNGFANNSSSSHSIVFLGDKQVDDNDTGDFGWQFFTAASDYEKKRYLFSTLLSQRKISSFIPSTTLTEKTGWFNPFSKTDVMRKFKLSWGDIIESKYQNKIDYAYELNEKLKWRSILEAFSDVFGEAMIKEWNETPSDIPYVDHQSVLSLPINYDESINLQFTKEFFEVLLKNNFVFLGGNDNDIEDHELESYNTFSDNSDVINTMKVLKFIGTDGVGPLCVYDEENEDYILQHRGNGNKLRISFNSDKQTKKSSIPELVDLKITDYCDYGCKFCYQSSTKKGSHASFENLKKSIEMLRSSGTMEIAIGGGEPTMHPDLYKILNYIRELGMTACFTTKNFDLHTHPDFLKILKVSNSIAFSCNSVAEIKKVSKIRQEIFESDLCYDERPKIYVQMIPELMSDKTFESSLICVSEMYGVPVTLLGYKDFGFGEKYLPKNRFSNSNWIKTIKNISGEHRISFGIDSILVSKWKKELIEENVDPLALVGEEGKFSCYFDAVEMMVHKSSFSKEPGIKLTGNEKNIKEQFMTF